MNVLVIAALTLCVAVQVFAEPVTKEEVEQVIDECTKKDNELDADCFLTKLQIYKGIDENKLKEVLMASFPKMEDKEAQELVHGCADKRGEELMDCLLG